MTPSSVTEEKLASLWKDVLSSLRAQLNEPAFKTWIEPLVLEQHEENVISLGVPNPFFGEWVKKNYHPLFENTFAQFLGVVPEIRYRPAPQSSAPQPTPILKSPSLRTLDLNPRYTFESFVVGNGNRFAHAAAVAVASAPAHTYNPLLIYGSVGLGKTHLMQAIAHALLLRNPSFKVLYLTSESFTNQLITAIQNRSQAAFRSRFRNPDALLIDDIHFIAGKEATQEEFFHTFNALHDAHKQIILTSGWPPREIPGLELRLVSRFSWGLVTDIQPPDFETRVAILKKKLPPQNTLFPEEALFYIARKIKSNIRELEGALIRVLAYASLHSVAITLDLAKELLKHAVSEESHRVNLDLIQQKVADYFQLKVTDLRAKTRSHTVVFARQVAMYLVRELTSHALTEVGAYFGGRNHATVIHACRKINNLQTKDPSIRATLEEIRESLSPI